MTWFSITHVTFVQFLCAQILDAFFVILVKNSNLPKIVPPFGAKRNDHHMWSFLRFFLFSSHKFLSIEHMSLQNLEWVDECDTGAGPSQTIQKSIDGLSPTLSLHHPDHMPAISPRPAQPPAPHICKDSCRLPIRVFSPESVDSSSQLDLISSLCEELSSKPSPTVTKRKRVTPTLVSPLSSVDSDLPDLDKEVGQILLLLASASARVKALRPLRKSTPETSFDTNGVSSRTRRCFQPPEQKKPRYGGFMDPQDQGRAMLQEWKRGQAPTGKTWTRRSGGTATTGSRMLY